LNGSKNRQKHITGKRTVNNADLEKEVKRLVHSLRNEKGYVCALDVLMGLNYLSRQDYESWRFGKVGYLEKVCNVNLSKLNFINELIGKASRDLKMERSITAYMQFGKGIKRRLRFSKSGIKSLEDRYSTHYIDKKRLSELKNDTSRQQQNE
jgi:hypothetical protein